MRIPLFDPNARRKTVSITLNADLAAKAAEAGINLSRTAEEAIAKAFTEIERERIREELREAARFTSEYVAKHGHPFEDWASNFSPDTDADDAA
jgi:antitoxin CcdA